MGITGSGGGGASLGGATANQALFASADGASIVSKSAADTLAYVTPLTTKGDLIYHNGTASVRIGMVDGQFLVGDTAAGVKYRALLATDIPTHASSHLSAGADAIKIDDLAAGDDNTDLDASTTKHGLMQKYPNTATRLAGTGSFTEITEDEIAFYDEFIGAALEWPWRTYGTSGAKTITVAGGKVTFAVTEGTDARWENGTANQVIAYTGCHYGQTEYIVKISGMTFGVNTAAHITISNYCQGDAQANRAVQLTFGHKAANNYYAASNPNVVGSEELDSAAATVYLKIRMIGGYITNYFTFWFSTDGTTWTQVKAVGGGSDFVISDINENARHYHVGIGVFNWSDGGNYHAVSADFEWFKIVRVRGTRA